MQSKLITAKSVDDTIIIISSVTLSPVSVAALGLVSESRGLSLRFPRFIKVREDKSLEEASSPEFLEQMWRSQQGKAANSTGADEGDLVDIELGEQAEGESESESDS